MALTQVEADTLLQMPKVFVQPDTIEFNLTEPMYFDRELRSTDRREGFLLTVERGNRNRLRLKYQTRARRVIVLARLELNGPRHRNPTNCSYKPGAWISGTHLHLYREGFDDKIAYELHEAPNWTEGSITEGIIALEHFMRFCAVEQWPPIQTSV
jgi:hypothetical protein